ncbi:hypothetical protein G6F24_014343 [Rhizopus arrhizus]|nr:hypothetical protein G6F24_014343 [Rhizopus arrhizus]
MLSALTHETLTGGARHGLEIHGRDSVGAVWGRLCTDECAPAGVPSACQLPDACHWMVDGSCGRRMDGSHNGLDAAYGVARKIASRDIHRNQRGTGRAAGKIHQHRWVDSCAAICCHAGAYGLSHPCPPSGPAR